MLFFWSEQQQQKWFCSDHDYKNRAMGEDRGHGQFVIYICEAFSPDTLKEI